MSDPCLRPDSFDLSSSSLTGPTDPGLSAPLRRSNFRRHDLTARHWQNRWVAWQARENRQQEERAKLDSEQRRIFGGENEEGDEFGLCARMLEFFGALDFIEE